MQVDLGVTRPNVLRPDFDLECRQVDLSRRLGGNLTSPDLEKNRIKGRVERIFFFASFKLPLFNEYEMV